MSTKVHNRQYKLFGKRVLIKIYKTPVQHGSLILPVRKETQQGRVIYIGDKVKVLKPGDDILYDAYKGTRVNGLLLLDKEDILARIDRGD